MKLLLVHCPVCGSGQEVSKEAVLAARQTRCGACGLGFVLCQTPVVETTSHRRVPESGNRTGSVPAPPVVYANTGMPGVPVPPNPAEPESAGDSSRLSNSGHVPPGFVAPGFVTLGPPPPYRPIQPAPRPKPPPVEMVPVPAPAEINLRGLGALGPPPPYRPIIRAGSGFTRGPAPDLEPWRIAAVQTGNAGRDQTRKFEAADEAPRDELWLVPRDPERNSTAAVGPEAPQRFERDPALDTLKRSVVWPAHMPIAPPGLVYAPMPDDDARVDRSAKTRVALWAGGAFGAIVVLGAAAWIGFVAVSHAPGVSAAAAGYWSRLVSPTPPK